MPISDNGDYDLGHFERVYEFIIKPSVLKAGFVPVRADEIKQTNYIVLDIVKRLISCEMAICDLSSRNPNVLYELGIRQAFNLPVALIKDDKTDRVFDIQGFRYYEYNSSLRVDEVDKDINHITENIISTFEKKDGLNSLIEILGVTSPLLDKKIEISQDTTLILQAIGDLNQKILKIENTSIAKSNPRIVEIPYDLNKPEFNYFDFKTGDKVYHQRFGEGEISNISFINDEPAKVSVVFKLAGHKELLLRYAKLMKVNE